MCNRHKLHTECMSKGIWNHVSMGERWGQQRALELENENGAESCSLNTFKLDIFV